MLESSTRPAEYHGSGFFWISYRLDMADSEGCTRSCLLKRVSEAFDAMVDGMEVATDGRDRRIWRVGCVCL
jgi:hypothetical protein